MMEVANVELGFWGILACCYSWAEVGSEGWTLHLPLDLVQCSHLLCEHFPTDPRLFWMQFPPCWDRTKWSHTDILSVSLWSWWLGFQARNDNHLEKCKWEPWSHISEANSIQVFPLKHWIFYFFFLPQRKGTGWNWVNLCTKWCQSIHLWHCCLQLSMRENQNPQRQESALLKTPSPSLSQHWGHNQAVHPAGAERLKTREASVKQWTLIFNLHLTICT